MANLSICFYAEVAVQNLAAVVTMHSFVPIKQSKATDEVLSQLKEAILRGAFQAGATLAAAAILLRLGGYPSAGLPRGAGLRLLLAAVLVGGSVGPVVFLVLLRQYHAT